MNVVLLILSLGLAGLGLCLLGDFLLWLTRGHVVSATISGFQAKKDKGLKLPIVSFEKSDGAALELKTQRIDQLLYLLNRPEEGWGTTVIYLEGDEPKARIYGYINLVAGLLLLVPVLMSLALNMGQSVVLGQIAYVLIFAVITIGGWVLLKLIQRYY